MKTKPSVGGSLPMVTPVNCKDEFAQHFTHVEKFHSEHRMNNQVICNVIIPAAKRILTE
jgi:hypothetical protein